jgi:hypothetical protein
LLVTGACTVSTTQPAVVGTLGFTVGDPIMVGYAPGQIDHLICVITDVGGTIDVGMPTEGTITPVSAEVLSGVPDPMCPPTVGAASTIGFALFHWKTTTGHALAPFTHTKGSLGTTPVDVALNGEPFAGYVVAMPNPAQATGNYQLLTFNIAYRNPTASTMTVPARAVPYALATVPALTVLFPAADKQVTDMNGDATVAVSPPPAQTAVFVTPQGGDPVVLTTIHP